MGAKEAAPEAALASLRLQDRSDAAEAVAGGSGTDDDWDSAPTPKFAHASDLPADTADAPPGSLEAAARNSNTARGVISNDGRGSDAEPDSLPTQQPLPTPLREIAFDGGHVLELYNLTSITTSTDLDKWLQHVDQGVLPAVIRWVDEEHALALFSDPESAQHALKQPCKFRLRPFAKASVAAKAMPAKQLAPPVPRPKTTAAVASRLISSALGMRSVRDKAAEADIAAQRKQQAENRRRKQACLAAAWDDI